MKIILLILAAGLLGGCASWNTLQSGVAVEGAKAADEQLETARWAVCDMPTAGALRRKYQNDDAGLAAWQAYCSTPGAQAVSP
ncbi:MAG: hypothetical protein MUF16_19935 [Burkholderiaceae bacterium]|jgi:uncharacterized protein YceK|nr:hypothetical protein [Burkholderiaceae bacterium]